jgi:hypothetical protein
MFGVISPAEQLPIGLIFTSTDLIEIVNFVERYRIDNPSVMVSIVEINLLQSFKSLEAIKHAETIKAIYPDWWYEEAEDWPKKKKRNEDF